MDRNESGFPGSSHGEPFLCCGGSHTGHSDISRRNFIRLTGTGALGTVAFPGLSWSVVKGWQTAGNSINKRLALSVKPILTYEIPERRPQTSWRAWGGIQSEKAALDEMARIKDELSTLAERADFPVSILPVSGVRSNQDIAKIPDLSSADIFIVYAAGGGSGLFDTLNKMGKNTLIFCRHKSGPVYLWYEIISPRYLRQHTDKLSVNGIDENDVVVDSQDELMWRLRALCGLKNTIGSRILAIGGAGAWSQPLDRTLMSVAEKYRLDIEDISYDDLGRLITEARSDQPVVSEAGKKAAAYMQDSALKLETDRKYVENCFILENILVRLMEKFNCRAVTINNCMGTIMPLAETSACLTLSLLNDAGYLAFCESDFVVVPAGILLGNISGKPVFLNDPTWPHDGVITLAHCTAPRRMNGKDLAPARILSHFESDYGAAPKVEMKLGQIVTSIMPDFAFEKYIGLPGTIIDNPFLDICRSQIDVKFSCDSRIVAEKMPGFHWITLYGDYIREAGYALKKIGLQFECLT